MAGFDVVAIPVGGGNLRISILVLLIFVFANMSALLKREVVESNLILFIFIVFTFIVCVSQFRLRPFLEMGHWLSVLASFFFAGQILGRKISWPYLYRAYLFAFRLQIGAGFLIWIAVGGRIDLFYYEPSYFVLASAPYLVIATRNILSKPLCADLFVVACFLMITQSATLIALICLAFAANLVKRPKALFWVTITAGPAVLFFLPLALVGGDTLLTSTISGFIESPDKIQFFIERGGNRWPRLILGWDLLWENWKMGIGPGQIGEILSQRDLSQYVEHRWWMRLDDKPLTNVFLELAVDVGVITAAVLAVFILKIAIRVHRKGHWEISSSIAIMLIVMLGMSSVFRPYVWLLLGFATTLEKRTPLALGRGAIQG
ncbi:O-antigen ligase family protein [Leisingera daeponensis]|uniref:O-antigen ligase family protein n=1 Tax=Leisingera daeponensis TaxID=405746 RepID=UPI001AD80879|nr:O-antigen ligase family protein [Leisingera daeponensis]